MLTQLIALIKELIQMQMNHFLNNKQNLKVDKSKSYLQRFACQSKVA